MGVTNHLLNGMILQVCFVEPKGPPKKIIRSIIQVDSNARIVRLPRMHPDEHGGDGFFFWWKTS